MTPSSEKGELHGGSTRLDALPPFDGPAEDPDNEPWDSLSDAPDALGRPSTLAGGAARAVDLVWTQKPCVARWLWPGETAPVPVIVCYAAPSADSIREVLARHAPSRVLVVTDLDPWGVALALHLRLILSLVAPEVPVLHRGVGDALLALSDAWLPDDGRSAPSLLSMPLSPNEIARWRWLRPVAREEMGPASMALLDAGHKREVEGATNPDCHRAGYTDALRAWLFAP
jgi:hypothetical protein